MTIQVEERVDRVRGCGWRKPGGIYLMGGVLSEPCCKLPFPLTVCPTCSAGFKPSRSWTWVDAGQLLKSGLCDHDRREVLLSSNISKCPTAYPSGKYGLIWIGEAHYKTPGDFLLEAGDLGISHRISTVPKEFKLDKTWVLLAHRKGMYDKIKTIPTIGPELSEDHPLVYTSKFKPAIFAIFRPRSIEYVVRGDETEEELECVVKQGLTPVSVVRERGRRPHA